MSDEAENLISQLVTDMDPGAMVTKFVVLAEGIDPSGQRSVYSAVQEKAQVWDTLGLLAYAFLREAATLVKDVLNEDE